MLTIASYFVTGTRQDGTKFKTLSDERPEWLQDAVYRAHQGSLPHDWIYQVAADAAEAIDNIIAAAAPDGPSDDGLADELSAFADAEIDVYTQDVFRWAADTCLTDFFSAAEDEAAEFADSGSAKSVVERLQLVQCQAILAVAREIWGAAVTELRRAES